MANTSPDPVTEFNDFLVEAGQGFLTLIGVGLLAGGIACSAPAVAVVGGLMLAVVVITHPTKANAEEPASKPAPVVRKTAAVAGTAAAIALAWNAGASQLQPLPTTPAKTSASVVASSVVGAAVAGTPAPVRLHPIAGKSASSTLAPATSPELETSRPVEPAPPVQELGPRRGITDALTKISGN